MTLIPDGPIYGEQVMTLHQECLLEDSLAIYNYRILGRL